MKKLRLRRISFGSYMKLVLICSTALPLMLCIIIFIMAIFGGTVTINGTLVPYPMSILYGAGIGLLFPISWGIGFCIFALLMYPSFCLALYLLKGIRIKANLEVLEDPTEPRTQPDILIEEPQDKASEQ